MAYNRNSGPKINPIDQDIRSGQFHNIYLLCGSEDYLKRQYCNKLITALIDPEDTMNLTRFDNLNADFHSLKDTAETLPFFADRRVITVNGSGWFASSQDELSDYLEHVPETTYLIFMENSIKKTVKSFKAVQKYGCIAELDMPSDEVLKKWIIGKLKADGKSMTMEAWNEFLARTNSSMDHMNLEYHKLLSYIGDRQEINIDDVTALCPMQIEGKIFKMIDAIASKNVNLTFELYKDLLLERQSATMILWNIQRQFQRILDVRRLRERGLDAVRIAQELKLRDFMVQNSLRVGQKFSEDELIQLLTDAADYESMIKNGRIKDQAAVEMLMLKYCK